MIRLDKESFGFRVLHQGFDLQVQNLLILSFGLGSEPLVLAEESSGRILDFVLLDAPLFAQIIQNVRLVVQNSYSFLLGNVLQTHNSV